MAYDYGYLKGNEELKSDQDYTIPRNELKELTSSDPKYSMYVQKNLLTDIYTNTFVAVMSACMHLVVLGKGFFV